VTQVPTINSLEYDLTKDIGDLCSDITLISYKLLIEMQNTPKIRQGQRINLVQVTGNTSIFRYVEVDLYFHPLKAQLR
jgi:hypothetical protein